MNTQHLVSALALSFATLVAQSASATPFVITSTLTGDIRLDNPDNLFVDVTITGDTTSDQALWTIDINSPDHTGIKLDEFYFNLVGDADDYVFSNFSPVDWAISTPATVQGAGGTTFLFETLKDDQQADNVTNTVNLTFTMTYLLGDITEALFLDAPFAGSNDAGSGQLGAHLQSLTTAGNCGASGDCSDSGFAFGDYEGGGDPGGPPVGVPEPGVLVLLGLGAAGMGWARRRRV